MAEVREWEFPRAGDHDDDEDHDDDTDDRNPLLPREGDWTEGRDRPRSHESSSRHQYETGKGTTSSHTNPSFEGEGEGISDDPIIIFAEKRQNLAKKRIQEKYPAWNPSKSEFVATINNNDQVVVSLIKGKKIDSEPYVLFKKDGTLRAGLPSAIVKRLEKATLAKIDERYTKINELQEKNDDLMLVIGKMKKKYEGYDQKK